MRKLGALFFIVLAAQALPGMSVAAQDTVTDPATRLGKHALRIHAPTVASKSEAGAPGNDVTGAIDNGSNEPTGPAALDTPNAAIASYPDAFKDWRDCVVAHRSFGNPPPQCEPLRAALRQAIGFRPRG